MKINKQIKGKFGEIYAAYFLILKGYKILDRNFTSKTGEIDIIAFKNGTYVFVEVKYRTDNIYGNPREAVDGKKQKHIFDTSEIYMKRKGLSIYNTSVRYDIIEIVKFKLNHIKNALR